MDDWALHDNSINVIYCEAPEVSRIGLEEEELQMWHPCGVRLLCGSMRHRVWQYLKSSSKFSIKS